MVESFFVEHSVVLTILDWCFDHPHHFLHRLVAPAAPPAPAAVEAHDGRPLPGGFGAPVFVKDPFWFHRNHLPRGNSVTARGMRESTEFPKTQPTTIHIYIYILYVYIYICVYIYVYIYM